MPICVHVTFLGGRITAPVCPCCVLTVYICRYAWGMPVTMSRAECLPMGLQLVDGWGWRGVVSY